MKRKNGFNMHIERFGIQLKPKHPSNSIVPVLAVIVLIALFVIAALKIQGVIQSSINSLEVTDDLSATWIGSLASYWGGILGGIMSGALAMLGVVLTIKYYRDSDATNKRIEHMPFLMAAISPPSEQNNHKIETNYKIRCGLSANGVKSQEKVIYYTLTLKNIGQGFASTLTMQTGENFGGIAFNEIIQVGDKTDVFIEVHLKKEEASARVSFGVLYIDCMTNEYFQKYTFQWEKGDSSHPKVESGYPQFLGQTHNIGK